MHKLVLLFVCLQLAIAQNVTAECNQADDPCAPKKELDAWVKSAALGFNMTSGNSDTILGTALLDINKETDLDIWDFDAAYGYGKDDNRDDLEGEDDSVTRNDARASGAYKHKLSERTYIGVDNRFLYDEIAEVDYRYSLTPLIGYFLIKDAEYALNVETGPGYLFERVGGETNDYLAPRIGEGFSWVISCTSKLYQKMDITLDAEESDNYLFLGEVGLEAAVNSSMSLVFLIRQTYDNVPADDLEKNDLAVITALKVAL